MPSATSTDWAIEIPLLKDRSAIQHALTEVARAIANNNMDTKRAGLLLYSLQIASQNARNQDEIIGGEKQVREVTRTKKEPTSARRPPPKEDRFPQLCPTAGSSKPSKRTMKPRRKRSLRLHARLNQADLKPDPTGI